MKSYSPDWPSHSVFYTLQHKMKVTPSRRHWSFDPEAHHAQRMANINRKPRAVLTDAQKQERENARLIARLAKIIAAR
jgi:hypothetical protein